MIFSKISFFLSLTFAFQVMAENNNTEQCIPKDQWLIPSNNKTISNEAYFSNIAKQGFILLGEHHANENHHIWQLALLKQLYAKNPDMIIGLEMFPRQTQPILDKWIKGDIEPSDFIKLTRWDDIWAYDFNYYLPMLTFAQQNQIPLIAINADKSLLQMIRKVGWKNIPEQHRMGIGDPAKPTEAYVRQLALSFQSHFSDPSRITKTGFLKFVQQQLLWDRVMAQTLADAKRTYGKSKIIGIVGSWHIINRHGIPYQLENLGIKNVLTLVPWDENLNCDSLNPLFADAVFGISQTKNLSSVQVD